MIKFSYPFLEGATADVTTSAISTHRKSLVFAAWGTWGGGTAKVQSSADGLTWADIAASATDLTADGSAAFTVPDAAKAIRVVLSGATNPVLNAVVFDWEVPL